MTDSRMPFSLCAPPWSGCAAVAYRSSKPLAILPSAWRCKARPRRPLTALAEARELLARTPLGTADLGARFTSSAR